MPFPTAALGRCLPRVATRGHPTGQGPNCHHVQRAPHFDRGRGPGPGRPRQQHRHTFPRSKTAHLTQCDYKSVTDTAPKSGVQKTLITRKYIYIYSPLGMDSFIKQGIPPRYRYPLFTRAAAVLGWPRRPGAGAGGWPSGGWPSITRGGGPQLARAAGRQTGERRAGIPSPRRRRSSAGHVDQGGRGPGFDHQGRGRD